MVALQKETVTNSAPVRIITAGDLGVVLGRTEWKLHLTQPSVAEALRAIDVNTGGKLHAYLSNEGKQKPYRIALGREENVIDREELRNPSGMQDIYILPVVSGNESGAVKAIIGAILLIVAWWNPYSWFYIAGEGLTMVGVATVTVGSSLFLGGVTQMLTPTPGFDANREGDSRGSNIFGGNASAISQGGAVGLIYGRIRATPMPISISYTATEKVLPNSFEEQEYEIVTNADGVVEYIPITRDEG